MKVTVQKLTIKDVERFKKIRLRSLQENPEAFGTLYSAACSWGDDVWDSQIKSLHTFIATSGGKDLGVARSAIDQDDPHTAWIISMWTAPEARGRKVASQLLDAILSWTEENKLSRLLLDVVDSNEAAIRLYEKYGFKQNGIRGTFPEPREDITEHQRELKLN